MSTEDNTADETRSEVGKSEFPPVPEEAIVKPEEERPVKSQMRQEEESQDKEAETEYAESEDMDGDGSPDWDPAIGPGA